MHVSAKRSSVLLRPRCFLTGDGCNELRRPVFQQAVVHLVLCCTVSGPRQLHACVILFSSQKLGKLGRDLQYKGRLLHNAGLSFQPRSKVCHGKGRGESLLENWSLCAAAHFPFYIHHDTHYIWGSRNICFQVVGTAYTFSEVCFIMLMQCVAIDERTDAFENQVWYLQ